MDRIDKIQLDRVEEEVKKNTRRIDVMQKSLDTLYEDRGILEDIVAKVGQLQEQFALLRNRYDKNTQDIKQEVTGVKEKVDQSITGVGEKVEKNIGTLVSEIKTKQVVTVREGFFAKIKKLLRPSRF